MHQVYATSVSKPPVLLAVTVLDAPAMINAILLELALAHQLLVPTMEILAFVLSAKNLWVLANLICLITPDLTVIVHKTVFKIARVTVKDSVAAVCLFLAPTQTTNARYLLVILFWITVLLAIFLEPVTTDWLAQSTTNVLTEYVLVFLLTSTMEFLALLTNVILRLVPFFILY
jgi:hypothetical protein